MVVRLPQPGGDADTWGDLLNAYLEVGHNDDGTLKLAGDIAAAKAKANSAIQTINTTLAPDVSGNVTLSAADLGALTQALADLRYIQSSALGQTGGPAAADDLAQEVARAQAAEATIDAKPATAWTVVRHNSANTTAPSQFIWADTSGGPWTQTLPALAPSIQVGVKLFTGGSVLTINAAGGALIEHQATVTIVVEGTSLIFGCDGTAWGIL